MIEFLKGLRFYFDGCDAELNLGEFLLAVCLGASVIVVPLLLKMFLIAINFGG